jgi:hypothetical protein
MGRCGLMYMTHNREQWRDPFNTVMNLRVINKAGDFLTEC